MMTFTITKLNHQQKMNPERSKGRFGVKTSSPLKYSQCVENAQRTGTTCAYNWVDMKTVKDGKPQTVLSIDKQRRWEILDEIESEKTSSHAEKVEREQRNQETKKDEHERKLTKSKHVKRLEKKEVNKMKKEEEKKKEMEEQQPAEEDSDEKEGKIILHKRSFDPFYVVRDIEKGKITSESDQDVHVYKLNDRNTLYKTNQIRKGYKDSYGVETRKEKKETFKKSLFL